MVSLNQNINVNEIPERTDFTPVPPGNYTGMIVNSDMKPTKANDGQYLSLEIDIQGGEFEGRKLFENLNLVNKNAQAQEIAYKTLGEIARAVGLTTVGDSNQLHNKRFNMEVVVTPAKGEYGPGNRVKKYSTISTSSSPGGTAQTVAATPPWKR